MAANKSVRSFGQADHGIQWAASQLPQASIEGGTIRTGESVVTLAAFPAAKGEDDYRIAFAADGITVAANTAVGTMYGLLKLADMLKAGQRKDFTAGLRFRTRNYKHETRFAPGKPRYIGKYTDEFWETLCRNLVANQFNGLVFYPDYHFFADVLDYSGFPQAASVEEAIRTANREALNCGLAIAHKYGLKTFVQHYVTHFTQQLADAEGIPTSGRLAGIDHPAIERYIRWCYRETFKQLPDLDGLYFNYESSGPAWKHVLNTAIAEFNKMARKPIVVHRLWCFNDVEGMRTLIKSYKGRTILGHKVQDTNDTYYFPRADSHCMEWKARLGKDIEWMFLVGPCHNCGTNLCGQLWGDYAFVQELAADMQAKGADSFSFNTVLDFFSPDVETPGLFDQEETSLVSFNLMHIQAIIDYVNGRTMTPRQQGAALAERSGVDAAAGEALRKAILASSQIVILTYQQFCYGSSCDGFLNRGRYLLTQEPFYYYTATQMNDQPRSPIWRPGRLESAWIDKRINVKVTPPNYLQYIIDYVDPTKPKATLNPKKVADLIGKHTRVSLAALDEYRKLAGDEAADLLAPHIGTNALLGMCVEHEIRSAIAMYGIYFAKTKAQIVSALKNGIAELERIMPLIADRESRQYNVMGRVTMMYGLKPEIEIDEARATLALVQSADFPIKAYLDFIESRRLYNEVRRTIRPYRGYTTKDLQGPRVLLKKSIAKAAASLKLLEKAGNASLAANVRAWRGFVEDDLARTTPPTTTCGKKGEFFKLRHDHCFRAGEDFVEDFSGFFKPVDYFLPEDLSFSVSHTASELVVTLRELNVDTQQRLATWKKYEGTGSDTFVFQAHVAVPGQDRPFDTYILWAPDKSVSKNTVPGVKAKPQFKAIEGGYELTLRLPFKLLGRKPKRGEMWGFNVTANPAVKKHHATTWAPQYDGFSGNVNLFGKVKFL